MTQDSADQPLTGGLRRAARSVCRWLKLSLPAQAPVAPPPPAASLPPAAPVEDARLAQARQLNADLLADIRAIPDEEWQRAEKQIRDFCDARQFRPDYTAAWMSNRCRLYLMVKWLEKIVAADATDVVGVELGGISPATDLINFYFPQIKLQHTSGDLRYPWEQASNSADVLVSTELLEHVSDLPEGFSDSFQMTGLKAVLGECYRVLKPGGALLITTPNAGSIFHLDKTLHGLPPWFYVLHVREYTIGELVYLLKEAGFQIELCKAVHCLTIDHQVDYAPVFKMLLEHDLPTAERGDDIFVIARK